MIVYFNASPANDFSFVRYPFYIAYRNSSDKIYLGFALFALLICLHTIQTYQKLSISFFVAIIFKILQFLQRISSLAGRLNA